MNGQFGLYTLIWLMVLLWSANFIIGKVALREFPPLLLGALRIGLAGVFVAPALWRRVRAGEQFRSGSDLGLLLLCALFFVGSRDTLRKYYSRTGQLLGQARRRQRRDEIGPRA